MAELLRRTLGEAIEVETVVGGGLWNTLVDPSQVENAMLNLAINARDAMAAQGGKLTIEVANASLDDAYAAQPCRSHAPASMCMLAVSDTGSGMSARGHGAGVRAVLHHQARGPGHRPRAVAMVYGFVKQSGGHIKLYSELGHGTTVKLYLPRSRRAEDAPHAGPTTPAEGGTETILVVEDDDAGARWPWSSCWAIWATAC